MTAKLISAFDLDRTLLKDNSSFRFGLYLCQQRHLSLSAWMFILLCNLRFTLGLLTIEQLHEVAFRRLFLGRSEHDVKQWAEEFLDRHLEQLIYQPCLERLKEAKKNQHFTILLSSSPEFLVEPIANRLGLNEWRSTKYAIDKDRRFCHISELMLGENKAQIIDELRQKMGSLKQDVAAFSDSHLDLPFLLSAGIPVGVRPDRKLRSICQKNQWPVI